MHTARQWVARVLVDLEKKRIERIAPALFSDRTGKRKSLHHQGYRKLLGGPQGFFGSIPPRRRKPAGYRYLHPPPRTYGTRDDEREKKIEIAGGQLAGLGVEFTRDELELHFSLRNTSGLRPDAALGGRLRAI